MKLWAAGAQSDHRDKWVNALVVCDKPKTQKIRVCLDPRPLNKAMRPHYPLPTLEDVTSKLAGAKYFSTLDARSGYWAIKVSEESSIPTTFNTIFGRYCFLRLPFGIVSAQDEFKRRVNETYKGLRGLAGNMDNMLCSAKQSRSTTPISEPCSTTPEREGCA